MMTANNRTQLPRHPPRRKSQFLNQPVTNRHMTNNSMTNLAPLQIMSDPRISRQPEPTHVIGQLRHLHNESRACLPHVVHTRQPTSQNTHITNTTRKIISDPPNHLRRHPIIDQPARHTHRVIEMLLQRKPIRTRTTDITSRLRPHRQPGIPTQHLANHHPQIDTDNGAIATPTSPVTLRRSPTHDRMHR